MERLDKPESLARLEQYGHGGDLRTAAELYGHAPDAFLDYSANMNPYGPPTGVRMAILDYAERIAAYPDPAVRELTSMIARQHGIAAECVLVGNGAAELIELAARLTGAGPTGLTAPCFGEYADAVRKAGGRIERLALSPEDGFALSRERLESSGLPVNRWLLGSPNNPTGRLLDRDVVATLLARGDQLILDEAFMDFVPEAEAYTWLMEAAESEQLLVIRSMTKFYAVPGIRLGYIVGSPQRIAALRELQTPWSVNSLAEAVGCAVLEDAAYAERTLAWLPAERAWLVAGLRQLGLTVYDSAANYVLVRIPSSWRLFAAELQTMLGRRGVLIRDASRYPGLSEGYLRLAVRLREDNERLLTELEQALRRYREEAEADD
ncbi:threonine-phosphate decarboxylase [Paenibacillus sp. 598K]|uniref:threonine-phosphate decarboxylase CobD n=1 Tax=Paenibacillus sp. 598K TaxID=1117987 RepID=UPI000FFA53F9|nr:threonine-phosphate decarboxylase CobD [Paenibacillus sp. 598K]GBF76538.1 threonine-phosphate decarboxylase [Paenibacillus sp. 598K]